MTPEEVPAELVAVFARAFCGTPQTFVPAAEHTVRTALAAVLSAYREQLGQQATGMVVHSPEGFGVHCQTCDTSPLGASDGDVDASFVLAAILGHATSPEHAARAGGGQ